MKKILLLLTTILLFSCGNSEKSENEQNEKMTITNYVDYKIESSEDISIKAINKNLSSYSTNELEELPINKRFTYKVTIPKNIKQEQIQPTALKILHDITSNDKDIDEVTVFIYSDKSLIDNSYDIAMATWAPKEEAQVNIAEIVKNNDRKLYEINIDIKENVEKYLTQKNKEETKFGLSENQRREIFKEIYKSEVTAREEADKKFPIDGQNASANLEKNLKYQNELKEKYSLKILNDYKITDDIKWEILTEATSENWSNK